MSPVKSVKRSEVKTFLNTTPLTTATYVLIGDGVTTGTINYNPKNETHTYIHEDSASTSLEGYEPAMPLEAIARNGDPAFEFVDSLRKTRAILDAAVTDVVNVWLYETPAVNEYPAEKQPVSIQVESFGGDGGQSAKLSYTMNYVGPSVIGTFNPTTKVFTPNP